MLITPKSTESYARREAGGKGLNLFLLARQGLPVPNWVVAGASYFKAFCEANNLNERISAALQKAHDVKAGSKVFGQVAAEIHGLIVSSPLSKELEESLRAGYATLTAPLGSSPLGNLPLIAVRSSALDEDSARHSFAGQLSSFLYVASADEMLRCVKECWASGFSERGLSYRHTNGLLNVTSVSVAVVLQVMVDSEISGVMFTCDPLSADPEKIVINSVYGIGEGLVSGHLDADTFVLQKQTSNKISETLASKNTRFARDSAQASGVVEVSNPPAWADVPSLDTAQLNTLGDLARKIERFYCFPQDVEWGFSKGQFFILQSRPVTTDVRQHEGFLNVWDNSNIVESYGGITLPLTFTFAHFVYHSVYVQLCEVLLVPKKEIDAMDHFLQNMLGTFYGRVYYNILNWYKLTSVLPGYKHNRSFMETMMGTQHQLADEIAERVKLDYGTTFVAKIRRFISGVKFFYFHLTAQRVVDNFLAFFNTQYKIYSAIDYSRMSASDVYQSFKKVELVFLNQWKAPIINDYLCMVHFGILKKLTEKWLANLGPMISNDLLCGDGNLESAEPTRVLIRIAALVSNNPELRHLIETVPAEDCLEALAHSSHAEFRSRVLRYTELYGHRCMSEMKLEQRDLHMDPSFLFVCLKNYMRSGQVDLHAYEAREQEIRQGAEKLVAQNLSGIRKIVYAWSLKHARRAVRNRENTRFCRTRVYGIVRRMFYAMGHEFTLRGLMEKPEDVFYLTLPEVRGMFDAVLPCQNVTALIELRKKEFEAYKTMEPAPRFMTRGITYWNNYHFPVEEQVVDLDLPENCMKGMGCCPGIVEGIVKVVLEPGDNMELKGEILVTMRTDPGWIPLYPSISGLLVERGGLLSHSAIVAREMGLPTVVSVPGLVKRLKSGMRVRLNGQSGVIEILSDLPE